MKRWGIALVVFGVAMAMAQARADLVKWQLLAAIPYLAAIRAVRSRAPKRGDLLMCYFVAGTLQVLLLIPPPILSDDVFRYLWDAHVAQAGIDPFLHAPSSPALETLRDAYHPSINHPDVPTIYPPAAQILFRTAAAISYHPLSFRVLAAISSLVTLWLVALLLRARGRDQRLAIAYGWAPLAFVESSVGGHIDACAVALLMAGLWAFETRRLASSGALFALSTGIKLGALPAALLAGRRQPLVLASFLLMASFIFWRRIGANAVLPGFHDFATRWQFNPSLFVPVEQLVTWLGEFSSLGARLGARGLVAGLWSTICAFLVLRGAAPSDGLRTLTAGALLLTPVLHPWYALWLLPLLAERPSWTWLSLTALLPLSYFGESWSIRSIEYGVPGMIALLGYARGHVKWRLPHNRDNLAS